MNLYAESLLNKLYEQDEDIVGSGERREEPLRIGDSEIPSDFEINDEDPRDSITRKGNEIDLEVRSHADSVAANDAKVLQDMIEQIDAVVDIIGNVRNDPSSLGSYLPSEAALAISDEKLKRDINNLLKQQSRGIADAIKALLSIKGAIQGIGAVQVGSKIADPTGEIDKLK